MSAEARIFGQFSPTDDLLSEKFNLRGWHGGIIPQRPKRGFSKCRKEARLAATNHAVAVSGAIKLSPATKMAHHALAEAEASDHALKELTTNWNETMAFQIAEVYAFRGENDAAFEWLNRALETTDGGLNVLLGNPVFEDLTSDERYHSLLYKLGLLQYLKEMKSEPSEI